MKKLLAVCLACLFLAGCAAAPGMDAEDPALEKAASETGFASLPETEALPALSVPAVVTEGRPWTEDGELPTVPRELRGWDQEAEPVALLDWTEDAALYGLAGQADRLLLQWGDTLAEFDWPYRTPHALNPQIWQVVYNDFVAQVVVCYYGTGTGVAVEQLHIVEKNQDGTLTDYCLPEGDLCGQQLTQALRLETVGGADLRGIGPGAAGDHGHDRGPGPAPGTDCREHRTV